MTPELTPAASTHEPVFEWPLAHMTRREFRQGDALFRVGEKANTLFYIVNGAIRLVEIDKVIHSGEVLGEMGIFSPTNVRTCSATCLEDVVAYSITKDQLVGLCSRDPNVATTLLHLSIKRFIENLKAETAARERIESELRIAREIQLGLVPSVFPPFPDRKDFDLFALMDPAKEVGGDLYDFFLLDGRMLYLTIGDVSGKGVAAALFMATTKALLKSEASRGLSPAEILARVNSLLCPDNAACMFVTLLCLRLDTQTGQVELANAGHNLPLICRNEGCAEPALSSCDCVLGVLEGAAYQGTAITLKPGDLVFLYTDGVTEAMNRQDELFSKDKLNKCLVELCDRPVSEVIQGVRQAVRAFADGAVQSDDITMLTLRYNGQ